jgi:SAM-dependent methyltransferase
MLADQENDFFTNKEILHFAPEPVLSKIIRNRAKKYLTADINPGKADMTLNIENIDQPDGSWDVIVCCHVLEHVNDQKSLTELHRILRPKSLLIVMVPIIEGWNKTYENPLITTDNDRHLHFGQFDHVRYYGNDFRDRLKQFGFVVREYSANGEKTVKYGLLRGEKVFLCTRESF